MPTVSTIMVVAEGLTYSPLALDSPVQRTSLFEL
jgi:hypothetical protein